LIAKLCLPFLRLLFKIFLPFILLIRLRKPESFNIENLLLLDNVRFVIILICLFIIIVSKIL